LHRPVQAAQGLPVRRRPADQQLREGPEARAARPAPLRSRQAPTWLRPPAEPPAGSLLPSAEAGGAEACRSAGASAELYPGREGRPWLMKLALYLPNFRDKVTVKELEDVTS